jgi:hypothetical protein
MGNFKFVELLKGLSLGVQRSGKWKMTHTTNQVNFIKIYGGNTITKPSTIK